MAKEARYDITWPEKLTREKVEEKFKMITVGPCNTDGPLVAIKLPRGMIDVVRQIADSNFPNDPDRVMGFVTSAVAMKIAIKVEGVVERNPELQRVQDEMMKAVNNVLQKRRAEATDGMDEDKVEALAKRAEERGETEKAKRLRRLKKIGSQLRAGQAIDEDVLKMVCGTLCQECEDRGECPAYEALQKLDSDDDEGNDPVLAILPIPTGPN